MKFVLVLLVSEAAGWAAADSRAVAEAHAGLAPAREGKYELSIPRYRAAIALDAHLPGINLNLGLAHFKLNQLPDAASAFERAAKADPASFQARMPLIKTPGRQEK